MFCLEYRGFAFAEGEHVSSRFPHDQNGNIVLHTTHESCILVAASGSPVCLEVGASADRESENMAK